MNPKELWKVTALTRGKAIKLFFLTALIMSIPYALDSVNDLRTIGNDMGKIAERIPAFVIEDGEIKFEADLDRPFISKTNTVTLFINSDQLNDSNLVDKEIARVPISLFLEQTKLIFKTPQQSFEFNYDLFEGLSDAFFQTIMTQFNNLSFFTLLPILIVSFLAGIIETGVQVLLLTMMVNIYALLSRLQLPFSLNLKFIMVASFIPVSIFSIMNSFSIYPNSQLMLISILTLYFYHIGVVKHLKENL